MTEPVFYHRGPGLTVKDIVELTGARQLGAAGDRRISDVASVERAGPHDVACVDGTDAAKQLALTQAGVCFVRAGALRAPFGTVALEVEDPYRAFVQVAAALYPEAARPSSLFEIQGKAPSALVHPTARVESGVTIDPAAVIAPGAEVGAGTVIGPLVVIGPQVRIGRDCAIEAGASITHALVGDRVSLGPGCRIGPAGMGKARGGAEAALGRAILQDNVRVGSNSTVERGHNGDTIVGEGTVLDPLVRIPADIVLGRYCMVKATGGVQGSEAATAGATNLDNALVLASQLDCADLSHS